MLPSERAPWSSPRCWWPGHLECVRHAHQTCNQRQSSRRICAKHQSVRREKSTKRVRGAFGPLGRSAPQALASREVTIKRPRRNESYNCTPGTVAHKTGITEKSYQMSRQASTEGESRTDYTSSTWMERAPTVVNFQASTSARLQGSRADIELPPADAVGLAGKVHAMYSTMCLQRHKRHATC